jgi:hypothetical protein
LLQYGHDRRQCVMAVPGIRKRLMCDSWRIDPGANAKHSEMICFPE